LAAVNFIGHAQVALWTSTDPAYVLGSMLPDFFGMAGLRIARIGEESSLGRGIALHHRTDDIFHASDAFVSLTQLTMDALIREGLPRGPARAVGHVGIELLIDGEILHTAEVADAYSVAIAHSELARGLLPGIPERQRWMAFEQRLRAHGVPYDYRNTDAVAGRLVQIFAERPRLALSAESERIVRSVLPRVQHRVRERMTELMSEIRNALDPAARANVAVLDR
jgi:hypothetical protein